MYVLYVDITQFMDRLALLIVMKMLIGPTGTCCLIYLSLYGIMPITANTGEIGTTFIFHEQALTLCIYTEQAVSANMAYFLKGLY